MATDDSAGSENARLEALRSYAVLDTDPEQMFGDITRFAAERFDAAIALISLVDEGRRTARVNRHLTGSCPDGLKKSYCFGGPWRLRSAMTDAGRFPGSFSDETARLYRR